MAEEEKSAQIIRVATTPCWGLQQDVADHGLKCAMLVTSCNMNNDVSTYEQLDACGRRVGTLTYDHVQSFNTTGNIIFSEDEDNYQKVADTFVVGAQVTDTDALALLNGLRVMKFNGTQAAGNGTWVVRSFDLAMSNTGPAEFTGEFVYYGFGD